MSNQNEQLPEIEVAESLLINEDQAKQMQQLTDLDHIGDVVGNWLIQFTNQLNHVLDMPENEDPENPDNGILVLDPEHPEADENGMRPLTEEERVGFMFGIRYVLPLVDEFPLKFMPMDADGNVTPEYASQHVGGTTGEKHAPIENTNN